MSAIRTRLAGLEPVPRGRPFIGRATELRQVSAACAAAAGSGGGSLAVVSGEPGIGKTCFCEEVARDALGRGLSVVHERCWDHGGAPAFWPWQSILAQLCGPGAGHLLEQAAATGPRDRFARFVAAADRIAAASERRAACLIVDDVHAADPSALLLLRFVAGMMHRLRLVLVLARRSDHDGGEAAAHLLQEIEQQGTSIHLRRFDLQETAALLAAHGLGAVDQDTALVLLRITGGNPLFLRRMAELGSPDAAGSPPLGLRAAVAQAWRRVAPGRRRVLEMSTVLGMTASTGEAGALAGADSATVLEAVREAAAAGLLSHATREGFTFSHETVRSVGEEALGTHGRLEAHARAAEIVWGGGTPGHTDRLARRAHHALQAAYRSPADANRAVTACREAAASAVELFAYDEAARLLAAARDLHGALNLAPPPAALLLEHAQAVLLAGRLGEARVHFDEAAAGARQHSDPRIFAEAALGLGGVWVNEHRAPVERARILGLQRDALAGLPHGELALRSRLRSRLAAEAVYDGAPVSAVREAVLEARGTGDREAIAEALSLCHHAMLTPEHLAERLVLADELVRVAAEGGLGLLSLMGLCWRAVDLFQLGDPGARRALDDLRECADAIRCQSILYIVAVLDVMLTIRAGRLDEAAARAERARDLGTAVGDVDALAYFAAQMLVIRWLQSREAELLDMALGVAGSPTLVAAEFSFQAAAASIAARSGRVDLARDAAERWTRGGLAELPRSSTWLAGIALAVDVSVELCDVELARQAYGLLGPCAELPVIASLGVVCLGSTERSLGLAALTTGDAELAVAHLERAVTANRRLENRPLAAIAEADLARALGRRGWPGDRTRALALLDRAATAARAMGMVARAVRWEANRDALETGPDAGVIARQGRGWLIAVGDRSTAVGDLLGMRYLAVLVARPGARITALSLSSDGADPPALSRQEVLDREARAAYLARAQELRGELAEAEAISDGTRAERVREEMEALVHELGRATALGGRARVFGVPGERARTAVRKAIKRAIDEIERGDAVIGRFLRAAIATGATCSYCPDPQRDVRWSVRR